MRKENHVLNPPELAEAKKLIQKIKASIYTLKKLCGAAWAKVAVPTNFGERLMASLGNEDPKFVVLEEKTSANALQYIVKGGY
ncbi:MAG: hypothetical protein V7650_09500 [Parasphingorhabdus sp.]